MKRGGEPLGGAPKRSAGQPVRSQGPPAQPVHQQKLTTNDALSYLREVKTRFADKKDVYDTFLEIMKEFKAQRIDTAGVIVRVKKLFKGHRELILGFNTFLPKGYEIELARVSDDEEEAPQPKQPVEFDQAINYVNKIKTRFASQEHVYKTFLEILNMYRKGQKTINDVYDEVARLFRDHQDLLDEFTYFLPDSTQPPRPFARPSAPAGRAQPRPAQPRAQPAGPPGSPTDHSRFMHKRKAARKAEEGFRRMDEEDGYGSGIRGRPLAKELNFLERVKSRLRSRDLYGDFLKCLNMFSQEIVSRTELNNMVGDILRGAPDLLQQFNQFVAGCEMVDLNELSNMGGRGNQMTNRDMLKAKLQKDKFMTKPLSEIVASETERITPSYVKMPPGYPKLICTGRSKLGEDNLNDQYVNVITGSEDYSFKLMRKNQYEEALFRCEDDRYEFDIAIEQNLSALRIFRPLVEKLAVMSPDDKANFRMEDVPGIYPIHYAHIQRLYADQGITMVDLLKKNPAVAVPVILLRLEQKAEEWRKVKEDMHKIWKRIFEQNYPRSLDHRSFYFKQQEKKTMMAKAMVSEVKEAADRRKADEQNLRNLSMAQRYSQPAAPIAQPDIAFEYADKLVFQDVYNVLKMAIDNQVHSGMREQVLMLYLQAVEPFFGLPLRSDEIARLKAEAEEDGGKDDGDMGDTKSESSEPGHDELGAAGTLLNGRGGRKTPTPAPEGTPENDMKQEQSGAETGLTDGEDMDDTAEGRRKRGTSTDATGENVNDEREQTCGRCRPVMPWCAAAGPSGNGHYVPPAGSRLLFGNEHIYVFFRFHRYLYDRLSSARKFSVEIATKKATAPTYRGGAITPISEAATPAQPDQNQEQQIREDAEKLHSAFLASVTQLLSNTGMDVSTYEDQVRALLGTNSYELFTLDKLLTKLVKHMTQMVQDEVTFKLWEMYRYEQTRSKAVDATVYHVNCHTVLDDTCYRIEFSDTDNMARFQMNDPEKSDGFLAPEGSLTPYLRAYINNPAAVPSASPDMEPPSPLYLKRTLPGTRCTAGVFVEPELTSALSQVIIMNGLECKIACASCKVSYVLDTEDVMVRRSRKKWANAEAERAKKVERLNVWMTNKSQEKAKEEEDARLLLGQ